MRPGPGRPSSSVSRRLDRLDAFDQDEADHFHLLERILGLTVNEKICIVVRPTRSISGCRIS